MTATTPDGPLGDRLIRLVPGQADTSVPMSYGGAMSLAIAGMGAGTEQCCFSTVTVPDVPLDCAAPVAVEATISDPVSPPVPDPVPEGAPPVDLVDFAVSLDVSSDCPLAAAGNACDGVLTLSQPLGDVTGGHLPLTLESDYGTVSLTGPLSCFDLGGAARFCQVPGAVISEGLTLPVTLQTPAGYQPRRVTICAAFAAPQGPALVRLVQVALISLGFDVGTADGQSGPKTRAAVAAFSQQQGLAVTDPLDATFLNRLGLGAFVDADFDNNRACVSTILDPVPAPDCDPETARFSRGACRCLDGSMQRNADGLSCSCARGTEFVAGAGCVPADRPAPRPPSVPLHIPIPGFGGGIGAPVDIAPVATVCDPLSTVKRGGACACRYKGMTPVSPSRCVCTSGSALVPGQGCS